MTPEEKAKIIYQDACNGKGSVVELMTDEFKKYEAVIEGLKKLVDEIVTSNFPD